MQKTARPTPTSRAARPISRHNSLTLQTAAQQFLKSHLSGKSRKTKLAYESDLDQFIKFTGASTPLDAALTTPALSKWIAELKRSKHKPSTIRRSLVTLNLFSDYSINAGSINESPFWRLNLEAPKKPRARNASKFAQVITSLRAASKLSLKHLNNTRPRGKHGTQHEQEILQRKRLRMFRNILILELLSTLGLRPGELSSLMTDDVRKDSSAIRITAANSTRTLPLTGSYQRDVLKQYLAERRASGSLSSALILNHRGNSLSTQGIQNALNDLARNSRIKKKITPRLLRQSLEAQMFHSQMNPAAISYVLGKQFLIGRQQQQGTSTLSAQALAAELSKLRN